MQTEYQCWVCECMVRTSNKMSHQLLDENCDYSLSVGLLQKSALYAFYNDFVSGFWMTLGEYFNESRMIHLCPSFLILLFIIIPSPPAPPSKPRRGRYKTCPMFIRPYVSKLNLLFPTVMLSSVFWNYIWQFPKSTILHVTCMFFPLILIFTTSSAIFSVYSSRIFFSKLPCAHNFISRMLDTAILCSTKLHISARVLSF
jgi:hypothetical protein